MNMIKRSGLLLATVLGLSLMTQVGVVQAEPFDSGPGGGQFDRRSGPGGGNFDRRSGQGGEGFERRRGGGPGNMQMRLGILGQYLDIVNSYHEIASNPEKSVAFNLQQLEHVYRRQGKQQEIVALYGRLLKESKNRTLRNLAYMKLSDAYRKSGQFGKAEELMQKALAENLKAAR